MVANKRALLALSLLFIGALLLAGCETTPKAPAEEPASAEAAARAITSGEYVRAAQEFERLAQTATTPTRQHYQLRAIELYLKAGQTNEARKKIGSLNVDGLDPSFRARKRVMEGQLAASEGDYARAVILLNAARRVPNLSPELMADIHWIRAQAHMALGKPFTASWDLMQRERYLVDKKAIEQNQLQLWKILTSLQRAELRTKQQQTRDPMLASWIELALISIENSGRPRSLAMAVEQWKQRYPEHPISPALLATITSQRPTLIGRVDRIALLLPLTSRHGRAAQAVRDGFMAMDRANNDPDKPRVQIYDIGDNPDAADDYYKQAVKEGAQLIVGPLGVEAVERVARRTDLSVPTLLLSHTQSDIESPNVYQFGLPPEQEAQQAAERAYLDGYRQAAVLFPENDWGKRMQVAFTDHWQRLGGILIKSQPYDPKAGDYSQPIRDLLNISQSMERKQLLQNLLKQKLELEPRARADIDFIFLAADPIRGRLIKPQLNYHQAAKIPVYATSHIYLGKPDSAKDADLNGVIFGDMPWMLLGNPRMESLREKLQQNWPYAYSPYDRLFALGVDSYAVIPHLGRIASSESVRFNGVTSGLSVDRHGRLHRQLIWARFRRGVPRILDTFVKYKEHLDISDGKDAAKTPEKRSSS
ncbi:MAG: penicillin-binding protein activator [Acidiferrobacterales bacterium]|jgi:outer membrane PBP1 activator LpoA protein|nr:penicillin-binding protein activator [Acidiferrobacterales bacterium]